MSQRRVSGLLGAVLGVAFAAALCAVAQAQDFGTFDPFVVDQHSVPDTVATVADPTGLAPTARVFSFSLPAGACSNELYEAGSDDSDCKFNSARSQYRENVFATKRNANVQPKESWYGWAVYFPEDFPYGTRQTRGSFEFAYWHNHQCPHLTLMNWAGVDDALYLGTNRALGNYECAPGPQLKVADFSSLLGKWNRFEVFVRWANDKSGLVKLYLDGRFIAEQVGPNLTAGLEDINYFKFGLYLCCTPDHKGIKEARALYSSVKRADTREGLLTDEDGRQVKALQEALNRIGCEVGTADGVIGRRTREQALSCRAFPEGTLPAGLTAGSLRTFVALYSGDSVAGLPPGTLGDTVAEVPLVTNAATEAELPAGMAEPNFIVHASELMAQKRGRDIDVNSNIVASIEGGGPGVDELAFIMVGRFSFESRNFQQLEFILLNSIKKSVASELQACGAPPIAFPDGSLHVDITLRKVAENFVGLPSLDCVRAALPKKQSAQVAFLLEHFYDIAIGTVRDGTIKAIRHEGVAMFLNRVAVGEIAVMLSASP